METTTILILLTAVVILSTLLSQKLFALQIDSREPPILKSKIPYIGHVINLLQYGQDYYVYLDQQHRKPIYTLQLGPQRVYVASSPEWCQAVHKNHKTLVFNGLVAHAMEKAFLFDKNSLEVMNNNLYLTEGSHGVMAEVHDQCYPFLLPGQSLDSMNYAFFSQLPKQFSSLAKGEISEKVRLFDYIRPRFAITSMYALYGPKNIFALNPELEEMFWLFSEGIGPIMASPAPSITHRKVDQARRKCMAALEQYAKDESWKEASGFIQKRFEVATRNGLTLQMAGRAELSMMFGLLVNTVPASFWVISFLFADQHLLSEVRAEIEKCIRSDAGEATIYISRLKSQCPLLLATIREVLRTAAPMNAIRVVKEETSITGVGTGETHVLKQGSFVVTAANAVHASASIWGPGADTFDPRRFYQPSSPDASLDLARAAQAVISRKVHPGAFRAFGSGINLCPGRHFAQTEIAALTALMVLQFDLKDALTRGPYKPPKFEPSKVFHGVVRPDKDVEVTVTRRPGWQAKDFVFEM
ncbi:cytochrome P450 [Polychaeton citri CBS 116435]|uniref:Cytochrome P450 n=1 Tax=Polychaeton citri CBS 116435 TaxID=1314669 RepID=A0A9P4UTZ6_9PEZI|nr:cytochrome P450 [Polychaeton citri CBS 116435]